MTDAQSMTMKHGITSTDMDFVEAVEQAPVFDPGMMHETDERPGSITADNRLLMEDLAALGLEKQQPRRKRPSRAKPRPSLNSGPLSRSDAMQVDFE